jgi:hypothetical protein
MPFKDPERKLTYEREQKAKLRRARGAIVKDDPNSIKNVQPWREYGVSRVTWFRRFRWLPSERERWRHREKARCA